MEKKLLKDLKVGEFFTLTQTEEPKESQVWVRSDYDRTEKKYEAYKFADTNYFILKKGTVQVYVGFTF